MNVESFKDDVREGRIDADWLVDQVVILQRELQAAKRRQFSKTEKISHNSRKGFCTLRPKSCSQQKKNTNLRL